MTSIKYRCHLANSGGFLAAAIQRRRAHHRVVSADAKLALVSLTVLPFVILPTRFDRPAHPENQPRHAERQADLNQILQETSADTPWCGPSAPSLRIAALPRNRAQAFEDQRALRAATGYFVADHRDVWRNYIVRCSLTRARD